MSAKKKPAVPLWDEQAIDLVCAEAIAAIIEYRKFSMRELSPQVSAEERDGVKKVVSSILLGGEELYSIPVSRFEAHLVHAIASVHRDYDHWNG